MTAAAAAADAVDVARTDVAGADRHRELLFSKVYQRRRAAAKGEFLSHRGSVAFADCIGIYRPRVRDNF